MIRDVIPRRRQTGHHVIIEGTCLSCVIGTAGRLSLNRADAGYRSNLSGAVLTAPRQRRTRVQITAPRAFSRTAPVTRRHLEANLRPSTGWTGLLEVHRSQVEVLVEAASGGDTEHHAGAGARYAAEE